jgi:endo-1,4-beta-D-glucanase Y
MRRILATLCLLLCGVPAMAAPPASFRGSLQAPELWQAYKKAFVSPGGRVVDNANNGISHSEGQGYGMLLAVAADDPATFATLWTWTRSQLMLRDDGLAAWRWDPAATPHVGDRNNAADGDILIAWALAEAGEAWGQASYKAAALSMIRSIAVTDVGESPFGPVLKPGVTGFAAGDRPDGPVVNLSYWVFPALQRFGAISSDPAFGKLADAGLAIAAKARFGQAHLPSDWLSLAGPSPTPAQGFAPTFGYDAIRIPLYLVWGRFATGDLLDPYATFFAASGETAVRLDVTTGQRFEPFSDSGYRAIGALARCVRSGTTLPAELRVAEVDRYYPTTLRALVLIAARQVAPQCL